MTTLFWMEASFLLWNIIFRKQRFSVVNVVLLVLLISTAGEWGRRVSERIGPLEEATVSRFKGTFMTEGLDKERASRSTPRHLSACSRRTPKCREVISWGAGIGLWAEAPICNCASITTGQIEKLPASGKTAIPRILIFSTPSSSLKTIQSSGGLSIA